MKNTEKKLEGLLQTSVDDWGYLHSLKSYQIEVMLRELQLMRLDYELRLFKAGTRASRTRLTKPLENIAMLVAVLRHIQWLRTP